MMLLRFLAALGLSVPALVLSVGAVVILVPAVSLTWLGGHFARAAGVFVDRAAALIR